MGSTQVIGYYEKLLTEVEDCSGPQLGLNGLWTWVITDKSFMPA